MRNIVVASFALTAVCIIVVSFNHWLEKPEDATSYGYNDNEINVDFEIVGAGSLPVEYVDLEITVEKESENQISAKDLCDSAAAEMVKAFSDVAHVKIDPKGISVDKETDHESKTSKVVVARDFLMTVKDIDKIEEVISAISRIDGCMIRSTHYRTDKIDEIRNMAVEDAKVKIDNYCQGVTTMFGGKRYHIRSIRIDDQNPSDSHGFDLFAASEASTVSLQKAEKVKRVQIRIEYHVSVAIDLRSGGR